jgi:hypothetical protein
VRRQSLVSSAADVAAVATAGSKGEGFYQTMGNDVWTDYEALNVCIYGCPRMNNVWAIRIIGSIDRT